MVELEKRRKPWAFLFLESHRNTVRRATGCLNRDYFGETATGSSFFKVPKGEVWEMPMLNVFQRDGDGIRHFWGSELLYAQAEPGQDPRHKGSLDILWNFFDLTPGGRGTDWRPRLSYA